MNGSITVQIYPVGLLRDLKDNQMLYGLRYLRRQVCNKNFRAVRLYFNGYLAELENAPADWGAITLGHGWTQRRALRSLTRNVATSLLEGA